MIKKAAIGLIRLVFAAASIGLFARILPFYHFRAGFFGAIISGAALTGLYPLMRFVIYKSMGLVQGACPMPKFQKWLVLAFWAGTSIVLWLASLIVPAWLSCGGILGAIPAGLIVLFGVVLANIFTRPLQVGSSESPSEPDESKDNPKK
jgi:hypothetical protein